MRRTRIAAAAALVLLMIGFALMVILTTPWHPLPGKVPGGSVPPDAARDFTAAQIARETAYHDQIRPWGLTELGLGLAVPILLGFTPLGARLVSTLRRARWWVQVAVAAIGVTLITTLVTLPVVAREHVIERRFDLTRQDWLPWLVDQGRAYLVLGISTVIVLLVVMGLARKSPARWWLPAAGVGAALVMAGSFVYPIVIEPVFNNFHSLPDVPLRQQLLALAERDHQHLSDILWTDASRRTTTENAYVSGFGPTKRLVLYDNLISQDSPQEIEVLTAHELGHSKNNDVLHGTIEGAIAVAAAMCALFLLLGSRVSEPRKVPLLLALYVTATFAVSPLTNLVSRHIEARADAHALKLTNDPATFIQAQKRLALSGLDDLKPDQALYVLFFNHPSAPERIAMARDYAKQHDIPLPHR